MKDKNKRKNIQIDPFFILGILDSNNNALGGPIENPNNSDVTGMLPDYERVNVNRQTAKGAITGAIEGASTGASIGSMIPGVGTLIGAGAGAIIGGIGESIKGRNNAKDIQEMNEEMFRDITDPIETFALGGELNFDPPVTNPIYYRYKQRPQALYRNTNNVWEIDPDSSGTFLPLNDPSGERVKEIMTHGDLINMNRNIPFSQRDSNANIDKGGYLANGGELNVNSIIGPTHEEGGIPMAGSEVEGGETKLGDYIFSDRLTPEGSKRTFAQRSKIIELKYKDRDNDGPAQRSKTKELESLMAENEMARKKEEMKQAQLETMLQADAYAYGGYLKYEDGGTINIDPKMSGMFKSLAKKRGMQVEDYTTKLYALGGPLGEEGNPPYLQTMLDANREPIIDPSLDPRFDYMNQQLTLPTNDNLESNTIETPDSSMLPNKPGNPDTRNFNFGNEEAALLLSNLPALDNYIESFDRSQTRFGRVSPNTVSLDTQRDKIESEYAKARGITRENIRGNATSAGQALSNMAAANAALTGSLSDDLTDSFLNEETANTQILNQANQLNTEIGNQEVIANEQNQDLRRSLKNRALADVAMNSQMYLRDKKLTAENIRQNDRLMQLINSAFPNYKFDSDNGEFAIKFLSQMQEAQNLLP